MPKKTNFSELQTERYKFKPQLPSVLSKGAPFIQIKQGAATSSQGNQEQIKEMFPNTYGMALAGFKKGANSAARKKKITVGVVLSGGQAPGGHNVIAGLFDGLKKANKKNVLIGFIGGPSGIIRDECKILEKDLLHEYRNTGGFDCIQSGRTKIETIEHLLAAKATFQGEKIDALVIIGGDDSNTNAAVIAEFAKKENIPVSVIGVPKTIDGDLKNDFIEASFGFDTATKIYSELAGNICRDANSAQKYWHFIRLMGRSASHITLEVGFKTQPNVVLIGEEVKEKNKTLAQVIDDLAEIVIARAQNGKNFGVILVPEGLIEFIPEFKELINALNDILSQDSAEFSSAVLSDKDKKEIASSKLPPHLSALLNSLPNHIAMELLLDRDPHGNVVVSQIETEKLLIGMLKKRLAELKKEGKFDGKFAANYHFFGYEGRCGIPSNFDANYSYALGYSAAILALNNLSGYMASVRNLTKPASQWTCGGIPITMLLHLERRKGEDKPVIKKALVDLNDKPFKAFERMRKSWAQNEDYIFPGPIQYFGPKSIVDMTTKTLQYEQN